MIIQDFEKRFEIKQHKKYESAFKKSLQKQKTLKPNLADIKKKKPIFNST